MGCRCVGTVVLLISCVLGLAVTAAQTASLTVWNMPYATAFPGGIALDDGMLYVACAGGMEVYRLDPGSDIFRGWGVSEGPQDVTVAAGIAFASVREADQIGYFNPGGLATNSALVPFQDVGLGEIHRGADTTDGKYVFWIAETYVHGVLSFEYDPSDRPDAIYDPSDQGAYRTVEAIEPEEISVAHEQFAYDTSLMPAPYAFAVTNESPPFAEWRLPLPDDIWVTDLAVANGGAIWISVGLPILFRFDPAGGTLQEMETIPDASIFQGLLPDPDGSIWFSNLNHGSIGHFDPTTGLSEEWRVPGVGEVYDLVFDADGCVWFTDRVGDAIGRLDPSTSEALVYPLAEGSEPLYLAIDDAGDVWFSAGSGNYVGRLHVEP